MFRAVVHRIQISFYMIFDLRGVIFDLRRFGARGDRDRRTLGSKFGFMM